MALVIAVALALLLAPAALRHAQAALMLLPVGRGHRRHPWSHGLGRGRLDHPLVVRDVMLPVGERSARGLLYLPAGGGRWPRW
ncbi:MAG: hypothetical protein R3A52_01415 [Polyangiales bacterium]